MDIKDTSYLNGDGTRFSFHKINEVDDLVDYMNSEIKRKGFATVEEFRKFTNTDTYIIKDEMYYGWYANDFYHLIIDRIVVDPERNRIEYQTVIPKAKYLFENRMTANDFDGDVIAAIPLDNDVDKKPKEIKMSPERFRELLDELDGNSLQTLKEKNARYAKHGDCLHNFRSGSEIMGCSPAQACWRYMAKHLADLRNKIDANDFSNREDFLEKCQDIINYIRFLWCIGNDSTPENEEECNATGTHKYERIIRVYSKINGMLYATFTMDDVADVETFDHHFIIHGVNSETNKEFKTVYSFDKFFCTVTELYDGEIKFYQNLDRKILPNE